MGTFYPSCHPTLVRCPFHKLIDAAPSLPKRCPSALAMIWLFLHSFSTLPFLPVAWCIITFWAIATPWLWLIPTYFILHAKYLISSVVHSARWTHYKVKLNISQMWSTLSLRFSNLIWNLIIDLLLAVGTRAATWLVCSCPSSIP